MKIILPFFVSLVLLCETAISQNWSPKTSGTSNDLFSVYFTSSTTGYVVGASGTIRKTTNGGASWAAQTSGTTEALWSVHFPDANTGYAVGDLGKILQTTNGGSFWTIQTSGTLEYLSSVYFTGPNTGYAAGTTGTILTYTGSVWTAQTSGTTNNLFSIFFIGSTGYVVGDLGTILKTNDGGSTWVSLSSGTSNVLRSVYFTDANTGYAVSESGTIHKTSDGGSSWTTQNSGTADALLSVHFPTTDTGYVVSGAGLIIKTTNGGSTWLSQNSGTTNPLWSVYFTSANIGYAVGLAGTILYTEPCIGFAANAGNDTTICGGTSTIIGGTPAATGGASPYSYFWSPSNSLSATNVENPIATPLSYTVYYITATDNNGCTATDSFNLYVASSPTASITKTDASCSGVCDGTLSASASGGPSPYSFSWSGGLGTGANKSNVCSGTYSVTVTGGNGCTGNSTANVITTNTNSTAPSSITASVNPTCGGPTTLSQSGGTLGTGANYYWYTASCGGTLIGNGSSINVSPSSTTTYYLRAEGTCNTTACANVTVIVNTNSTAPASASASANPICQGNSATLSAAGGTLGTGASYNWYSGSCGSGFVGSGSSISVSPSSSTTYYVLVSGTCNTTSCASITLIVNVTPTVTTSSTDVSCNGGSDGSATANPAGFNYSWSSGGNSQIVNNLVAGTHTVTVTDPGSGCSATASTTITEPSALAFTTTATNVSCNGGADASATVTASGGTTPYSYFWNNGQTTVTATGLIAETSSVTVTDANGCTSTGSATTTEPTAFSGSVSSTNVSCFGGNNGTATANGSGGITPYSYLWFNGNTAQAISNLAAGTYNVTLSDANGCGNLQYSATVTEPPLLSVSASNTSPVCLGQSAAITSSANGGTGSYSFLWSPGGEITPTFSISPSATTTQIISVTDANGCTTSDSTTIIVNPLPIANAGVDETICLGSSVTLNTTSNGASYVWNPSVGLNDSTAIYPVASPTVTTIYSFTATDANGCVNSDTVTVTVNSLPTANAGLDDTICSLSDTVFFTASGGVSYSWAFGDGNSSTLQNPIHVYSSTNSYNVGLTITDANGCIANDAVLIHVSNGISSSATSTNVSCFGASDGTATALPGGFSYNWSSGSNLQNVSGLSAGTYFVTVTEQILLCSSVSSVTITEPSALIADAGIDGSICMGTSAVIGGAPAASGGTSPYTYSWNPSTGLSSATIDNPIASPTTTTTYTLNVTDANSCNSSDLVTVTVMMLPTVNAGSDASICDGASTALTATGAISYSWSNGATTSGITVTPSVSTPYSVTGTDASGCSATDSVSVVVNLNPTATAYTVNTISCNGGNDGEVAVSVSSGTSPYSYLWNNGATTISVTGLIADTFNVTVTDANGCWVESYTIITDPTPVIVFAGNDTTINPGGTATLTANVSGGSGSYTYSWSNGATTNSISANSFSTTSYSVTATDAYGCSNSDTVVVIVVIPTFSIYGTIYNQAHDTSLNNGMVYLFQYDTVLTQFATIDSTALSGVNGDYVLSNLSTGQYIILFRPDTSFYPNAIPTYFGDTTVWSGAQVINLISDSGAIDISTREVPPMLGIGIISGFIQYGLGTGKTGSANVIPFGDPVPGVDISLEQIPGGIVKHTETDNSGFYSFSGLPLNSQYKLLVDVPGLPMDSTYTVNLTSSDTVETNLDYVVDTTTGSAGIFIGYPLGIKSHISCLTSHISIYPNPGSGKLTVEIKDEIGKCELVVFNILGEVTWQAGNNERNNQFTIDLTNKGNGVYYLQLKNEKGDYTRAKIVLQQ